VKRFKVLSENIQDEELPFLPRIDESEAGHYTTFITYARKYGVGIDVSKSAEKWIDFEASIIENYGKAIQFTVKKQELFLISNYSIVNS
jgi:tRNA-(ms[2]io[6]A)-hydroxylase